MLPKVIAHSLVTLDGKIEGFHPDAIGLYYELAGQLGCDGWLVGSDTLLAAETAMHPDHQSGLPMPAMAADGGPLMAVLDSRGRIRNWSKQLQGLDVRGLVVLVAESTSTEHLQSLSGRDSLHPGGKGASRSGAGPGRAPSQVRRHQRPDGQRRCP